MLCHNRFMKFMTNRYHSKSDKIHLGLGVTLSTETLSRRPVAIYLHIIQFLCGSITFIENLREICRLLEKL